MDKLNRFELIEAISQNRADAMELDALIDFFKDHQASLLDDLTDKELAAVYKEER